MQQKEIIERLKTIPTGDLTDSMRRLGISGYTKGIYCLQGKPTPNMVGQALTVQYIEKQPGQKTDFVGGQFAFARMATDGQVIFIDAKGTQCWLTGGNVCRVAELAGAAGVVVDGCLRVVPGDIVVGDDDGIVVIPADRAEEIVYQAEDIADIEIKLAEAVERQASLEELGVIGGRKAVVRK